MAERHCREIICPICDHKFMWLENDGLKIKRYRLSTTRERLENTKCPKCGETVILIPHELKGASVIDDRITYESCEC